MTADNGPGRIVIEQVYSDKILQLAQYMGIGIAVGLDSTTAKFTRAELMLAFLFMYYLTVTDQGSYVPETDEEANALMRQAKFFIESMSMYGATLVVPTGEKVQ